MSTAEKGSSGVQKTSASEAINEVVQNITDQVTEETTEEEQKDDIKEMTAAIAEMVMEEAMEAVAEVDAVQAAVEAKAVEGLAHEITEGAVDVREEKLQDALEAVKDKVVRDALTGVHEHAEDVAESAAEDVIEDTVLEAMDPEDIELSQKSSGSEDEKIVQTRKRALQRMQDVMTKPSAIQDPNKPRITKDGDKELMAEHIRTTRDKAILQSMTVAERGYITRLRPPSVPTDKLTLSQYQIRPGLEEKFKSLVVKEMIHTVLNDELGGKEYSEEGAKAWSQSIANTIRMKVKEMGFPRYKFVVQCVIGQEHGAGVKIGSRCLWDADTDNYASDTFLNETIFCMTAVYAVYFY